MKRKIYLGLANLLMFIFTAGFAFAQDPVLLNVTTETPVITTGATPITFKLDVENANSGGWKYPDCWLKVEGEVVTGSGTLTPSPAFLTAPAEVYTHTFSDYRPAVEGTYKMRFFFVKGSAAELTGEVKEVEFTVAQAVTKTQIDVTQEWASGKPKIWFKVGYKNLVQYYSGREPSVSVIWNGGIYKDSVEIVNNANSLTSALDFEPGETYTATFADLVVNRSEYNTTRDTVAAIFVPSSLSFTIPKPAEFSVYPENDTIYKKTDTPEFTFNVVDAGLPDLKFGTEPGDAQVKVQLIKGDFEILSTSTISENTYKTESLVDGDYKVHFDLMKVNASGVAEEWPAVSRISRYFSINVKNELTVEATFEDLARPTFHFVMIGKDSVAFGPAAGEAQVRVQVTPEQSGPMIPVAIVDTVVPANRFTLKDSLSDGGYSAVFTLMWGKEAEEGEVETEIWPDVEEKTIDFTIEVPMPLPVPVISVPSGKLRYGTQVEITAAEGCSIRYSLDGSDPRGVSGTVYKPQYGLSIYESCTLKAVAFIPGIDTSEVVSAVYELDLDKPEFSVAPGEVAAGTKVTISVETAQFRILYTTNGDDPKKAGTAYLSGTEISIDTTMTLQAVSYIGKDTSEIATATYTVKVAREIAAPVFSLASGDTVEAGTKIALSTETEEAVILYTTEKDAQPATVYADSIVIEATTTIRALAFAGEDTSAIVSATYYVKEVTPEPGEVVLPSELKASVAGDSVNLSWIAEEDYMYVVVVVNKATGDTVHETDVPAFGERTELRLTAVPDGTYTWAVQAENAEGETSEFVSGPEFTVSTIANEAGSALDIALWPNPNRGEFFLNMVENATVEIFSANGVLVKRMEAAAGMLTVRLENSGLYMVRVMTAQGQSTVKRVVVR